MSKLPKLCSFVKPDIDKILELANFTEDEKVYFLLKTKDKSNVAISIEMNISEPQVSKLARRVKDKILRLIELNYIDKQEP